MNKKEQWKITKKVVPVSPKRETLIKFHTHETPGPSIYPVIHPLQCFPQRYTVFQIKLLVFLKIDTPHRNVKPNDSLPVLFSIEEIMLDFINFFRLMKVLLSMSMHITKVASIISIYCLKSERSEMLSYFELIS